ncbi:hypothetical protein BT69DRAFT_851858 [Atractiella rhizophila]|nr:hypothetical protein BT69DRAFT_851858 [Atractiella rhizophila]
MPNFTTPRFRTNAFVRPSRHLSTSRPQYRHFLPSPCKGLQPTPSSRRSISLLSRQASSDAPNSQNPSLASSSSSSEAVPAHETLPAFPIEPPADLDAIAQLLTPEGWFERLSLDIASLPPSLLGITISVALLSRLFIGLPAALWQRRRINRFFDLLTPDMRVFTAEFPIALRVKAKQERWDKTTMEKNYDRAVTAKQKQLEKKYNCAPRPTMFIPPLINIPAIIFGSLIIRKITLFSQTICDSLIPSFPLYVPLSLPSTLESFSSSYPTLTDILIKLLSIGREVDPILAVRLIEVDSTYLLPLACGISIFLSARTARHSSLSTETGRSNERAETQEKRIDRARGGGSCG